MNSRLASASNRSLVERRASPPGLLTLSTGESPSIHGSPGAASYQRVPGHETLRDALSFFAHFAKKACSVLPKPRAKPRGKPKGWDSTAVSRMGFSEPHDPPFSSHFSRTALTDTQSQSCNNSPDSATSRTAPVSRDGPNIRRKIIFGGSLKSGRKVDDKQLKAATPHPEKCTPNRRNPS